MISIDVTVRIMTPIWLDTNGAMIIDESLEVKKGITVKYDLPENIEIDTATKSKRQPLIFKWVRGGCYDYYLLDWGLTSL